MIILDLGNFFTFEVIQPFHDWFDEYFIPKQLAHYKADTEYSFPEPSNVSEQVIDILTAALIYPALTIFFEINLKKHAIFLNQLKIFLNSFCRVKL
jgi:hypothetical protein